ncbi:MAG TPA: energy transducer TonB [Candidatus Sulfotelmatobacter sp.]|jgi:TonB family protein|nr:energy transducer TonB [Candidatus Sulfotelmatobacter sp.]
MKRRIKIVAWCLVLCVGTVLAAQEPAPETNGEPASQQPPPPLQQRDRPIRIARKQSPQGPGVKWVRPVYPAVARAAQIQGRVVLKVTISPDGEVEKVDLLSGHPILVAAAIDAVKQWRYQPSTVDGQPAGRETDAVVDFSLESREGTGDAEAATGAAVDAPSEMSGSSPATPHIATPQRIRVSQGVADGLAVKKVTPEYPAEARKERIQGTVLMHAMIDKAGDIVELDLVTGHPMLAPAAIDAVKQWQYKPYLLNGKPIEVDTQITVNFRLTD